MGFSLFGIRIEISYLFLSIVFLYVLFDETGIIIPLLFSVLIHETSHLFFIMLFKSNVQSIKLILGAISIEYTEIVSKSKKNIALLAGPVANLLVSLLGFILNSNNIGLINLILCFYNLLPISGLDGGEIFKELLCYKFTYTLSNKIVSVISLIILSAFLIVVLFSGLIKNISAIILFIYIITPLLFKKILKETTF